MAVAMDPAHDPFQLGEWQVDATGNRLVRGTEVRPLRHKAMALLVLLARHPGQTVSRETIEAVVWQGNRFVAPKAINTAVWTIRQALDDDAEAPRYLETIAKKGYRLIAPVRPLVAAELPPPPAPRRGRWFAAGTALLAVAVAALFWAQREPAAPVSAPAALATPEPLTQYAGHEYVGRLSPDGRWLAFGWWQGRGDGGLFLRPAGDATASPESVGAETGDLQGLAWSPDGAALAFVAVQGGGRCGVWRYTLADRALTALATCSALFTPSIDWSPDGRHIAFSATADGAGGLFRIGPDGQGLRRLTAAPPAAIPDHQPAWSPDGRRLAFVRQDPADGSRDLHETGADGGDVRRLSTLRLQTWHGLAWAGDDLVFSTTRQDARVLLRWRRADGTVVPLGLEGSAPARAPDGRLVYALMRSHVGLARLDGALPQRLQAGVASDRAPALEPGGGGRLAFVSRRSGHAELWLAAADGQAPRALTRLEGTLAAPAWSPRGRELAFVGGCGPGRRVGLCHIDADSGRVRPLAADAAGYGRPAWHPDGATVWAASNRGGRWQLWRFPAAGGEPTVLASELPPAGPLQWTPDGAALVYQPLAVGGLRWRPAAGGAERALAVAEAGEALVDWRIGPQGLVVLLRGARERFRQIDLRTGAARTLSEHPLGTFPERARFTLGADGTRIVELAHTAVADLMQVR